MHIYMYWISVPTWSYMIILSAVEYSEVDYKEKTYIHIKLKQTQIKEQACLEEIAMASYIVHLLCMSQFHNIKCLYFCTFVNSSFLVSLFLSFLACCT